MLVSEAMQKAIAGLKPERVWYWFVRISEIFRGSGHEHELIKLIAGMAGERSLGFKSAKGWALVGLPDFSDKARFTVQSHLDMRCEPKDHDFSHGVILVREGDWMRAGGTSMGGDNGLGVAMMLALMEDPDVFSKYGRLELLFTCEEEVGLIGASSLPENLLTAPYLINLDSEDIAEICVGCAGGSYATITVPDVICPDKIGATFRVTVSGLAGGHSGVEIHRQRVSAIKVLARLALKLQGLCQLRNIGGGSAMNVIANGARAEFVTLANPNEISVLIREFAKAELDLLSADDQRKFSCREEWLGSANDDSSLLIDLLSALPQGVWAQDTNLGIVRTSDNLALLELIDTTAVIRLSLRSSAPWEMEQLKSMISSVCRLAKVEVSFEDMYPAWPPDFDSELLKLAQEAYRQTFMPPENEPKVTVIHAGLECGVIVSKHVGMQAISIGPTIWDVHSVKERALISSVEQCWNFLLALLASKAE